MLKEGGELSIQVKGNKNEIKRPNFNSVNLKWKAGGKEGKILV